MILVTWILTVLLACGGYLVWANNLDILLRPNELGDFLSGLAALLSLPSILIIMLENKRTQQQRAKQEAEANSLRQFQAFMTIHQALTNDFKSYLQGMGYYLQKDFPKRTRIEKFHAEDDIVSYLRAVHFGRDSLAATCAAVKKSSGLNYVAREFCQQIKTFTQFAQNTHYLDDNTLNLILQSHPCYEIYKELQGVLAPHAA